MRPSSDRLATRASVFAAVLMIAQQVGGKATRDAIFLSEHSAELLPKVMLVCALASFMAVMVATRLFARYSPARIVPLCFLLNGACYLISFAGLKHRPDWIGPLLYIQVAVFGALVISGFWSVINERFHPHSAKRIVARIGAGATFGGVAGGLLTHQIASQSDSAHMLLVLGVLNLITALAVSQIGSLLPFPPPTTIPAPQQSFASVLRKHPYLRHLAWLTLWTAVGASLLDYVFKAEAEHYFASDPARLLSFFAIFHTLTAVLSLVVQTTVVRPTLTKLGVGTAIALLPMAVGLTAGAATLIPRLGSIVCARGVEMVTANTFFRSGYELLYTPVNTEAKRPTKAFIDVLGTRLGSALGHLAVLLLLVLPISQVHTWLTSMAVLTSLLCLWLARALHRGYRRQLKAKLIEGIDLHQLDADVFQSLSTVALEREALFEQVAAHRSWLERSTQEFHAESSAARDHGSVPPPNTASPEIHGLRSGSAQAIRQQLRDSISLTNVQVPYVVALVARPDLHHDALEALRRSLPAHLPLIIERLNDPNQPVSIRRRLVQLLADVPNATSVTALMRSLEDERFEVRYRAGIALARLTLKAPEFRPKQSDVLVLIHQEITAERHRWSQQAHLELDTTEPSSPVRQNLEATLRRNLEHLFTLLSIVYDPQAIRLALRALHGQQRDLKDTATEYLESILPETTRVAIFRILELTPMRTAPRTVDELKRALTDASDESLDVAQTRRWHPESTHEAETE